MSLLLFGSGSEAQDPSSGPTRVSESLVEAFAEEVVDGYGAQRGALDLFANLRAGSESTIEAEETIAVGFDAAVRVEPNWVLGQQLRVTIIAYALDDDPVMLQEVVSLGEVSSAAWWVYRRTIELPAEFVESVLVVEHLESGRRGGARVGYGDAVAQTARTAVVVDEVAAAPTFGQVAAATQGPRRRETLLRLVPPVGDVQTGRVRVRTLVSSPDMTRVVFSLDGSEVETDSRKPFSVQLDLGDEGATHELLAVGYDAADRELGRDRLLLNPQLELFDVRLVELGTSVDGSELLARASVTVPRDGSLDRVEFFRNETLVETLSGGPFEVTIPAGTPGSADYVRVVGTLADGSSLEDVLLLSAADSGERLDVNLVEIFAIASDRSGDPIADLQLDDFEVKVGGRRVEIERFERAVDVPLNLGLVLDTSGSMLTLMPEAKQAGANFLGTVIQEGDRAFLIDFDTRPRLAHPLTADLGSLLRRFATLEAEGSTALYDAVVFGSLQFDEARGRRALVVLTDGEAYGGEFGARESIKHAIDRGVPVYLIDLSGVFGGTGAAKLSLVGLAKATGGRVYAIPPIDPMLQDYEKVREHLTAAYDQIHRELRSQYVLAFSTDSPLSAEQLRKVGVKVKRPQVKVRRVVAASG